MDSRIPIELKKVSWSELEHSESTVAGCSNPVRESAERTAADVIATRPCLISASRMKDGDGILTPVDDGRADDTDANNRKRNVIIKDGFDFNVFLKGGPFYSDVCAPDEATTNVFLTAADLIYYDSYCT